MVFGETFLAFGELPVACHDIDIKLYLNNYITLDNKEQKCVFDFH